MHCAPILIIPAVGFLGTSYCTASTAKDNGVVLQQWYEAVKGGSVWDHKGFDKIPMRAGARRDGSGWNCYTAIRGCGSPTRIFYDIWSNIHYGYVGRAHGIPADVLFAGQKAQGKWAGRTHWMARDNDDVAVSLGMDLWDQVTKGSRQLTTADVQRAVLKHMPDWRRESMAKKTREGWLPQVPRPGEEYCWREKG